MRIRELVAASILAALAMPTAAFAHVTVQPGEVGLAKFQTFTVGVPNEKDTPTVAVRLVLPEGLNHVSPTVKPGWTINVKRSGEGEAARATEIEWTGGQIPAAFRDEFTFSAQVPDSETELDWKAYQSYGNGLTVNWDLTAEQQPKKADGSPDFSVSGPFSKTLVVDDLAKEQTDIQGPSPQDRTPFWLSLLAVMIATLSFWRKPKPKE
jgi:uncharacterized protein YcnI